MEEKRGKTRRYKWRDENEGASRARGDVRGILLEILRDVNILLYIELKRQSEKVSPGETREASFPPLFRKFCLPLTRHVSPRKGDWTRTSKDGDAIINVIVKRD